jgi:mycoredoxin
MYHIIRMNPEQRSMQMQEVKLFTKQGCPYCAAMRDSLNGEGVSYTEIDVHSSAEAMKEALNYSGGRRMVPILVRDGNVKVAPSGG